MSFELPTGHTLRHPRENDHPAIVAAITDWWDTPNRATIAMLLPRLFLQFFTKTSWVLESESGEIAAFLIGFRSADDPTVAYIHFVGVDQHLRNEGVGRGLYENFFDTMKAAGCTEVRAITGPFNARSLAFHKAMGFTAKGDTEVDGVLAFRDYDGPGGDRVLFTRAL
ncbi:MAG: GNAT family N-acetyltransferase [Pseudolysinimonas sp.]